MLSRNLIKSLKKVSIPYSPSILLLSPFKPLSIINTRNFNTTNFKLKEKESNSIPSLPSPSNFPTTTTLNSTRVSSLHDPKSTLSEENKIIKHAIGKIERRLQITFTCTATIDTPIITELNSINKVVENVIVGEGEEEEIKCGHRSTHEFSKRSYDHGIVLIECPGCKNRHLIADNLAWFSDTPSESYPKGLPSSTTKIHRTIEDLMKEKGEAVKWIHGPGEKKDGTWELQLDLEGKV